MEFSGTTGRINVRAFGQRSSEAVLSILYLAGPHFLCRALARKSCGRGDRSLRLTRKLGSVLVEPIVVICAVGSVAPSSGLDLRIAGGSLNVVVDIVGRAIVLNYRFSERIGIDDWRAANGAPVSDAKRFGPSFDIGIGA